MEKLIELAINLGPGVLLIAAILFFGKQMISHFFNNIIEVKKIELNLAFENFKSSLRVTEEENRQKFELSKLQVNQGLQNELNISLSKLQIETIKVNRVLPLLEETTDTAKYLHSLLYTYIRLLLNKGSGLQYEKQRIDTHTKLLELSGKMDLYLPVEINKMLNRIILLASNSFHSGAMYDQYFLEMYKVDRKISIFEDANNYVNIYFAAFFELISVYIQELKLKRKGDERILAVLKEYNISSETFKIETDQFNVKFIEDQVLLTEYR